MMRRTAFILLLLSLVPESVGAQDEERYAEYYGDGIRAYTESRYEEALENLYRAFAARQNPYPLELIIRAHDFQGNCSARNKAANMLTDLFPAESVPPPQRCYRTGTLHLKCAPGETRVRVDGSFDAACNSRMRVPTGRHRVESGGVALEVDVREDSHTVASLGAGRTDFERPRQARTTPSEHPRDLFRQDLLEDPDMPASFQFRRK